MGGTVAIVAMTGDRDSGQEETGEGGQQSIGDARPTPSDSPDATASRGGGPSTAEVVTITVTESQPIPFTETTVDDAAAPIGSREIRVAGVNGAKTLTYDVTYIDGVETDRKLVNEVVAEQPVAQLTAVGTNPALPLPTTAPNPSPPGEEPVPPLPPAPSDPPTRTEPPAPVCHPSYTPCVPIAFDVDCKGTGDGPRYVTGRITIVGPDEYELDRNNDGVGCDPKTVGEF